MSTSPLGTYLKARRAHVQPDDVALTRDTRSRVPGLRREEVAMLAGISVDYYARLEQGRERSPSPSVLNSIGSALCLDLDQRGHLFRLAGLAPKALAPISVMPDRTLLDLLGMWSHTPAVIINRQLDVMARNDLAGALYSDFGRIDNVARMTFLDPVATGFYVHWDRAAEACVANLRLALGHVDSADAVRPLLVELSAASSVFRHLWAQHDARGKTHESKAFHHRAVGELVLRYHTFDVKGSPGHQLIVYHAEPDSSSAEKLQLLASLHVTSQSSATAPRME
ncbi:helix-turn-helix domain-containing protein [Aeromicrobium sp. CTD01-1L150]|uniref:helix-turn-helix domain-containing protein n=1 Tax=Aeromicrobium sp. CTD01-1L150 TaxID=3341830 RepID=UPI0035C08C4C